MSVTCCLSITKVRNAVSGKFQVGWRSYTYGRHGSGGGKTSANGSRTSIVFLHVRSRRPRNHQSIARQYFRPCGFPPFSQAIGSHKALPDLAWRCCVPPSLLRAKRRRAAGLAGWRATIRVFGAFWVLLFWVRHASSHGGR